VDSLDSQRGEETIMGRPRKVSAEQIVTAIAEKPQGVMARLRVIQGYYEYTVLLDVADIIPYSSFKYLDHIFSKMGLIIKRQFGYLGFDWGYGAMIITPQDNAMPLIDSPICLKIKFQHEIDDAFIKTNELRFGKILDYIKREWEIYTGMAKEFE
jgi:hypothetical protein